MKIKLTEQEKLHLDQFVWYAYEEPTNKSKDFNDLVVFLDQLLEERYNLGFEEWKNSSN